MVSRNEKIDFEFVNWYDEDRVLYVNNAEVIDREFIDLNQLRHCI